ncbi:MAG: Stress response kinase A [Candidatus Heimdallarchaeota archaeon LC_3]|nr:MAG: Stress response kinase A [Candidatus Heimdallarchaeota archaeon LC_3]
MIFTNEMKQEIINDLVSNKADKLNFKIDDFQKLQGADTETFSFNLINEKERTSLILRIYRDTTERAEREFKTLQKLHSANLSVPKPYTWKKHSQGFSRSYLIMEKIPGMIASDYLFQLKSDEEKFELIASFIQELVNLHSIKWKNQFPEVQKPDIKNNAYSFVEQIISFPKEMIIKYNVIELKPLIEWLEKNKEKTENLSLLHGDYHMNNVIATPEGKLVIIDWANLMVGDYRHDLGFAIVATSSAGEDVLEHFKNLYQKISGREVKNIYYFMVLSVLHNLLRCYSALTNPKITNENEITKNMFMNVYKNYTQYLVKIVKEITGIKLKTLEEAVF